ncbi:unnamed protein product, partial [Arabidopsis halleri]
WWASGWWARGEWVKVLPLLFRFLLSLLSTLCGKSVSWALAQLVYLVVRNAGGLTTPDT